MGLLNDVGDRPIDNFTSIQLAIADAPDGGVVRVNESGALNEYPEDLTVNNKRIVLYGSLPMQGARVTGTGGASPALLVSGTGGVTCCNLYFSNAGTTATYIVEGNTEHEWFDSLVVNGGDNASCMLAHWVRDCLCYDGLTGIDQACTMPLIVLFSTVVNMSVQGIRADATGMFQGCLTYNCNGQGFVNSLYELCQFNAADDLTAPGPLPLNSLTLAQIAFLDYAGKDFRLNLGNSRCWFSGVPTLTPDGRNARKLRAVHLNRVYPGYADPWPGPPTWASGASRIRELAA